MTALETRLRRLEERHGPFNGDEVWGPVETAEKNFWKAVAAFEAWFTEADRHSPERHMNHTSLNTSHGCGVSKANVTLEQRLSPAAGAAFRAAAWGGYWGTAPAGVTSISKADYSGAAWGMNSGKDTGDGPAAWDKAWDKL